MKAITEYGLLVGLLCGIGVTVPALQPVVLALLALHFSLGTLRMAFARLWLSAIGTLLALIAIFLVWGKAWPEALQSGRLALAALMLAASFTLQWVQRRRIEGYGRAVRESGVVDLVLFRWALRTNPASR